MANYKVIQDIEAEDKLLGPLTLRQFIYAIIVVVCGFIAFKLATAKWFLALPFLPPMIFFATLAAPFGHDQSSEVWLLAKVRFFLKPRRRIWNQSGLKELVTITVPKRIEKHLTNELSQTEVRSRLQALANTIDSRGWAVKNVNVNMFSEPSYVSAADNSDRLLGPASLPQDVPIYDVTATDDMLDEQTNPTAQNLNQMMAASTATHKQDAIDQMRPTPPIQKINQGPPADYWFLHGPVNPRQQVAAPGYTAFASSPVVMPQQAETPVAVPAPGTPTPEEQAIIDKVKADRSKPNPAYGRLRTIQPPGATGASPQSSVLSTQPGTDDGRQTTDDNVQATGDSGTVDPAIIELANNDDLNVATIARQAKKATKKKPPEDEVVISLR